MHFWESPGILSQLLRIRFLLIHVFLDLLFKIAFRGMLLTSPIIFFSLSDSKGVLSSHSGICGVNLAEPAIKFLVV